MADNQQIVVPFILRQLGMKGSVSPTDIVGLSDAAGNILLKTSIQQLVLGSGVSYDSDNYKGVFLPNSALPLNPNNKPIWGDVSNDTGSTQTYTNFKDSAGDSLQLVTGKSGKFSYDGSSWSFVPGDKTLLDATLEVEQPNVAALDAAAGKLLNDRINLNTLVPTGSTIDLTPGLTYLTRKINMLTGSLSNNVAYHAIVNYPVTEGQTYYFSGVLLGSSPTDTAGSGVWGYDIAGQPVMTEDIQGLPVGMLVSNWRRNVEDGGAFPAAGQSITYTRKKFTIPKGSGIRYISLCTYFSTRELYLYTDDYTGAQSAAEAVQDLKSENVGIQKQFQYFDPLELDIIADDQLVNALTGQFYTVSTVKGTHNAPIVVRTSEDEEITISYSGFVTTNNATQHGGLMGLDADGNFVEETDGKDRPKGELYTYARYADTPAAQRPTVTSTSGGTSLTIENAVITLPKEVWQVAGMGYTSQTLNTHLLKKCEIKIGIRKAFTNMGEVVQELVENGGGGTTGLDKQELMESDVEDRLISIRRNPGSKSTTVPLFNFAWISDTHVGSDTNGLENAKEFIAFLKRSRVYPNVDLLLDSGDNTNGYAGRDKSITLGEAADLMIVKKSFGKPLVGDVGNHDDGINWDTGTPFPAKTSTNAIVGAEKYATYIQPLIETNPNLVTVPDKCYSYHDDASKKVRMIVVDRYECPVGDDGSGTGTLRYTNINWCGQWYSQEQLTWLFEALRDTPTDYTINIVNHGPQNSRVDFGRSLQGTDLLHRIINAWKTGTVFQHDYTHPQFSDMNTSQTFDFTSRGATPDMFGAYFGGHIHSFWYGFDDTFGDQRVISLPCTKTSGSSNSYTYDAWGMYRDEESPNMKNSGAIVYQDTIEKVFKIVLYGAFRDMKGNIDSRTVILDY